MYVCIGFCVCVRLPFFYSLLWLPQCKFIKNAAQVSYFSAFLFFLLGTMLPLSWGKVLEVATVRVFTFPLTATFVLDSPVVLFNNYSFAF